MGVVHTAGQPDKHAAVVDVGPGGWLFYCSDSNNKNRWSSPYPLKFIAAVLDKAPMAHKST